MHKLSAAAWRKFAAYWRASSWHRVWLVALLIILLVIGAAYGIGKWYKSTQPPQQSGVSFDPDYARYLGLNPETTMKALENIGVKNFRLMSYWSDIEPVKVQYDFSQLDWEFASANKAHAKVTLAIGLRQPRWPECHTPNWVDTSQPEKKWLPQLEGFMTKVINHYKNNPALESYQLENEYFNSNFGECHNDSRPRLISEYKLVKKLDPKHPIIITRSNKYPNLPIGQPRPDKFGEEYYRTVWWPPGNRFATYPYPAWYYSFLAGATKIATGRDSILTEVQAEPWLEPNKTIFDTSLAKQNQSFSAETFEQNIKFAQSTGLAMAYYWGAEYWYYRLVKLHDPSVWNVARQLFSHD
ncbi:MAG: hypothetical protein ACREHG_00135 [Candidatus Saccharimonadales bacterium]